ncbi:E set domain-containing protein [Wallemia mellicola]|uniref:Rho GDP-dissociation inhibitor n=1 Tax=Wallemia mellicola TaxID=1708541 RepID=A0AB38MWL9_9BASI|nr:E set domain-containing protein [Wallemia mellicola]
MVNIIKLKIIYFTDKIDDSELETSTTPGYNPGEKKTVDEYAKLDQHDESLNKWKASLGITGDASAPADKPKVEFLTLSLEAPTLNNPIKFNLSDFIPNQSAESKQHLKSNPVNIKENSDYNVKLDFKVNYDVISGLKYVQVVKRSGITVDKLQEMIGSYGPKAEVYEKRFPTEESPSGMLARSGQYQVRSRITDDDGNLYLDFEWSFKITKEW